MLGIFSLASVLGAVALGGPAAAITAGVAMKEVNAGCVATGVFQKSLEQEQKEIVKSIVKECPETTPLVPIKEVSASLVKQKVPLGSIAVIYLAEDIITSEDNIKDMNEGEIGSNSNNDDQTNRQTRSVKTKLQSGDILMTLNDTHPVFELIQEQTKLLPPTRSVIFRLRAGCTDFDEEALCFTLHTLSENNLNNFSRTIAMYSWLNSSDAAESDILKNYLIPVLPKELLTEFVTMWRTEKKLNEQLRTIKETQTTLSSEDTSTELLLTKLKEINVAYQSASVGIEHSYDLSYQIQHIYPYPIAYSYRFSLAEFSRDKQYKEQLRLAENILAFLASVSLSLLKPEDRSVLRKKQQASTSKEDCLEDFLRGGISPGDWKKITVLCKKKFAQNPTNLLEQALSRFDSKKKQNGVQLDTLVVNKNNFKHDRGPSTDAELLIAVNAMKEHVDSIFTEISFFTRFPILLVRDLDKKRRTSTLELKVEALIGDHPQWQGSSMEYSEALTKDELYIRLTDKKLVSLYPFITVIECTTCKNREVFFIDKWDGPGKPAFLKSFERGHSLLSQEIGEAINYWLNEDNISSS